MLGFKGKNVSTTMQNHCNGQRDKRYMVLIVGRNGEKYMVLAVGVRGGGTKNL